MANFTPSNLVAGQAAFNNLYKSGEWRLPDTAVLASCYTGQKANPALAALREREDRTVSAYLPIRRALGTGTGRTHNHTGARGDSAAVTLSWDTIVEEFSISLKQNDNNVLTWEENYAAQLQSCINNVLDRHDTAILTKMIADRTQINKGRIDGAWAPLSDVMEINLSAKDRFFHNIRQSMKNNLFRTNIQLIVDSLGALNMEFSEAQGTANATNLGYQFNGLSIIPTTQIISGSYGASALAFPMDLAGLVPWIPKQNRKPLDPEKAMSYNGDYGSISVPVLDDKNNTVYTLDFAIHAYAERADASASNGDTQDVVMQVEVSLDLAYLSAPLSGFRATDDTGSGGLDWSGKTDSVVYQFGLKTS